jgi:homospermidine synthase
MEVTYKGDLVIIGAGAVAQCLQQLLVRHIAMDFSRVTIIDEADKSREMLALLERGAKFIEEMITRDNYAQLLKTLVPSGSMLIDLAVGLDTKDLIDWCQENNVMYLNAAFDWWLEDSHLNKKSIYEHYLALEERAKQWPLDGPTALVGHGANPGLVSHWVKKGLHDVTHQILERTTNPVRKEALEDALKKENFAALALLTGTKVIHIVERDTQITTNPKRVNEFVNTWSPQALYEESIGPVEISWGTHEETMPAEAHVPFFGPRNHILLEELCMNMFLRSWLPSSEILGMLIRHEETYTISKTLTVWDNSTPAYRPTLCYVYLPCDSAFSSLHEMKMHDYTLQHRVRVINDDILEGGDELGVLLLGHDLTGWWTGADLTIEQTRALVGPGQNATTLQVAAGLLGALVWMLQNSRSGFKVPDALPYKEVLRIAEPYLGQNFSLATDWQPEGQHKWQFNSFFMQ